MPASSPDFIRQQTEFAAHIRNPDINPRPKDVEDRRMAIYRDLFYNNVQGFLESAFPVLRSITSDERWHAMARDFFASHHCHTPLFLEIPQEFLQYLQEERNNASDPAFMLELCHYEWVEMALEVDAADIDAIAVNAEGDLLQGKPVASPVAWPLAYQWPVHTIGPDYQPDAAPEQATYLIVYRGKDDQVHFLETPAATTRLLELVQQHEGKTGQEILTLLAEEMGAADPSGIIEGGLRTLEQLRERDVILGVR